MKKCILTLFAVIGMSNLIIAQNQINRTTDFSDFNKSVNSNRITIQDTPFVGFNFSNNVTVLDSGILSGNFQTHNCTKISVLFDMNLGVGKGLDVIVNGGNGQPNGYTDIYRTANNYPNPNTDWPYNRDFFSSNIDIKMKFSTLANNSGNSIVKNFILIGYPLGCAIQCLDSITTQPIDQLGNKGSNKTFSILHSGAGNNYKWQSSAAGLGWQNISNKNQYSGVATNNLIINNLNFSNHNQLFRVITFNSGCVDTSKTAMLVINDVSNDSLSLISLKLDTAVKGSTIRQLQFDLVNKHDTLYVGSVISSDTLKISIHTGISPLTPIVNALKVYPNPASTELNIQLDKPGNYIAKLSGIAGQTIITPLTGVIDISGLVNGVYILTIYDSNNKLISTNKISILK